MKKVMFEKISDGEYFVNGTHILLLGNDIVYVEPHGEQSDESAQLLFELYLQHKFIGSTPTKYLINLNFAGKNSPGARKTWQQIGELETTLKIAYYGLHPVAKVLASFVIGFAGKRNSRFFFDRGDAIKWLLE
jgi:hypothetical protein